MSDLSGAELFERLSDDEKARYITINKQMVDFARDHAVPIMLAPPPGVGNEVKGATGCVLRMRTGVFAVTASHVLAGYERRVREGERVNWQVGKLPPFDPLPRVAWRDDKKDIVVLHLMEDEIPAIGPCNIWTPPQWPPAVAQEGQFVLLAGFPGALREVDRTGRIGAGPFSALFRVTTVGGDYCTCQIEHKDLVSFNSERIPLPGTDMGGISGGPVFLLGPVPQLIGVITDHGYMKFADLELLRIATLESVNVQ
jgi:hypothetical protein